MCENSQRVLFLTVNFLLLPDVTLSIFIKTPNSHILAELMLILPNTMSLTSAVLSVLKKNILTPAGLQRNEILWF